MSAAACARLKTASLRETSAGRLVRAFAVAVRRDRPGARGPQLELREQRERDGERVEPGAEVRARRGYPDLHASASARRTASAVASTSKSSPASERAVSGSFSPLPVSTHTARLVSLVARTDARLRRPAIAAALAGSQKTPSCRATSR